mgnify:CR=1 FL=1
MIIVILNVIGQDDMNIFMIGLNPLLNLLDNSKVFRDFMNSGSYLWHITSFITNVLYGLILDFIRIRIKR